MALVQLVRDPTVARAPKFMGSRGTKISLRTTQRVTINGVTQALFFVFPFTPNNITIDGLGEEYATLDRPGELPFVYFSKKKPLTVTLKTLVTASTGRGIDSAEENIAYLSNIARSRVDVVVVGYGLLISGTRFRITDFNVEAVRLNPQQEMVAANVTITLTQSITPKRTVPGMIAIKNVSGPTPSAPRPASTGGGSTSGGGGGDFWTTLDASDN